MYRVYLTASFMLVCLFSPVPADICGVLTFLSIPIYALGTTMGVERAKEMAGTAFCIGLPSAFGARMLHGVGAANPQLRVAVIAALAVTGILWLVYQLAPLFVTMSDKSASPAKLPMTRRVRTPGPMPSSPKPHKQTAPSPANDDLNLFGGHGAE